MCHTLLCIFQWDHCCSSPHTTVVSHPWRLFIHKSFACFAASHISNLLPSHTSIAITKDAPLPAFITTPSSLFLRPPVTTCIKIRSSAVSTLVEVHKQSLFSASCDNKFQPSSFHQLSCTVNQSVNIVQHWKPKATVTDKRTSKTRPNYGCRP